MQERTAEASARLSRNRWRSSAPSRAPELEALRASVEEHKKATADMKTSIGSIEAAVEDTVTRLDDLGDQGDADMRSTYNQSRSPHGKGPGPLPSETAF